VSKPPPKNAPHRDQDSTPRSRRRRFTLLDKLRLLAEADQCESAEQVERLLCREGLPGSRLGLWRKQLASHAAPVEKPVRLSRDDRKRAIVRLEREKAALQRELVAARELLAHDRSQNRPPANQQLAADPKRRHCG
jgi:hypothetical protein